MTRLQKFIDEVNRVLESDDVSFRLYERDVIIRQGGAVEKVRENHVAIKGRRMAFPFGSFMVYRIKGGVIMELVGSAYIDAYFDDLLDPLASNVAISGGRIWKDDESPYVRKKTKNKGVRVRRLNSGDIQYEYEADDRVIATGPATPKGLAHFVRRFWGL